MPKVPPMKPEEVERILYRLGFEFIRQKGSHKRYKHADGRATTVPFHKGHDISPTLIRLICREINVNVEEFVKAL